MNIENGGIGLTDMSVIKESLGDKFPNYIIDKVKELEEKVKFGKVLPLSIVVRLKR